MTGDRYDYLTDAEWLASWEQDSERETPKSPVKREPTEAEIDKIYAESKSPEELRRRLLEAGMPMQYDGVALNADGSLDTEAPRYDVSGNPLNEAAWTKFRQEHPEYAELESGEARTVVDGIGRAVRVYDR